ncbi:MAG TPA: AAA family ATPase, partial [Nitriliruptorales bacterium]
MTTTTPRIAVVTEDVALTHRVRTALNGHEPAAQVITVGSLEQAADAGGNYDVLVAGPPCRSTSELGLLAAYHELSPTTSIVLAFDRPHVNVRHLIWTGADALVDPDDDEQIAIAVARSLELARHRRTPDSAALAPTLGRVYTVCSATGGCGKTFYSTNLAAFLARWTGQKVALVDLDLQFGEVTTALRLRVRHTILDALAPDGDDGADLMDLVPELLTTHEQTGVAVLAAPRQPGDADRVTPQEVGRVIAALRASYDHVVVDTPTGLGECVLTALDVSEHLFL